jgi:hypothetical protein
MDGVFPPPCESRRDTPIDDGASLHCTLSAHTPQNIIGPESEPFAVPIVCGHRVPVAAEAPEEEQRRIAAPQRRR